MKIETQPLENHEVKITAEIEDERLDEMKRRAASKLARRIKIPGFRPGKAPYPVIQRTVGEAAIFEEALELLVETIYPEVIEEAKIKPYGPGRLENVAEMEPLTLEFVVPLDAEVTLGDYKSIRKPYEPTPVSVDDIQDTLNSLRERQAIIEPVDRPAEEGDVVSVHLNGTILVEEQERPLVEERSYPLIIRLDDDHEWPYRGFSQLLIGKSAGASGSVDYVFPEDYASENMRNAPAHFDFEIENVKSRTLPELDDAFAISIGDFENLDALRIDVRTRLEMQAEDVFNETYDNEIIDLAVEQSEFKFASQMLEDEIDQVINNLNDQIERQGQDMSIYLKSRKMDEAALREEVKPAAEKRLKRNLFLFELGNTEKIQVEREELESEAGSTLQYLQRVLPEKESRKLNKSDVQNNIVNNVLVDLLTRKSIQRLRDYARGRMETPEMEENETPENSDAKIESTSLEMAEEKPGTTEVIEA